MNNILTQVKIDLYSSTSYEVIKAQQGDKNSRIIEFILYNQGEPYELSDNVFFRFVGHRGDGSSFSKTEAECITRNGNHVCVTLLEDVLYYDGTIEAKLVMYELGNTANKSAESGLNDTLPEKPERTVLSTIPFKISCIKNPCNENNLSDGELSIVTDLVFQMKEFSKNAQDVIDQAKSYAVGGTGKRENEDQDNAKYYYSNTKTLEDYARQYSELAGECASAAEGCANIAEEKSIEAGDYSTLAESFAHGGTNTRPNEDEDNAMEYAKIAQSYTIGGTGTRDNEDFDNARNYYEQARYISSSFRGALRPMGTVTFANLPALANAGEGDMYNISDQFTTNANFKEGSDHTIPAGANVYKTADNKWDILAGSPVTGVRGSEDATYQTGNVDITKVNIGLGNVDNTADADKSVSHASTATKATQDSDGNVIKNSYAVRQQIDHGNFNDISTPGIYGVSVSSNAPTSDNYWNLIVIGKNRVNSYEDVCQIASPLPINESDPGSKTILFVRTSYGKRWGAWKKIYTEGNLTPQDIGALPTNGGTITGDLRLKGSGNYGNKLNLGDGDFVHISEPTDDHLEIKGSYINFVTSNTEFGRFTLNGKDIFTIDKVYPIGSIYMSVNSTSPATLFGGTWVRWGNGRIPIGVDTSQTEFNTVEKTGGEKTHTLTAAEMPQHNHSISAQTVATTSNGAHTHSAKYSNTANSNGSAARVNGNGNLEGYPINSNGAHTHNVTIPAHNTDSKGSGTAHNNLPPYITCYMWKRTA